MVQDFLKYVVCQCYRLWEAVYGASNFNIDISVCRFFLKSYCCMICSGNIDSDNYMYLNSSSGVQR